MDLNLFARLVEQKRPLWEAHGIEVEFQNGPPRDKSAAWVSCAGRSALVQLIVWTSGEADLSTASRDSDDPPVVEHYEITSEVGLLECLDDVTMYLLTSE